jgi:hypothetical protein
MCLGQPAPPDQTQKGHPVESTSVTQPVTKRADQLVVGDRILPHRLPAVASKPGEVLFVQVHEYRTARWVFVAYRLPDGFYDSTAYLPDGTVEVYPESPTDDGEVTQPIAGRAPAELAGGLIQVDPRVKPVCAPYATFTEQRLAYERDEGEYLVSHGPVKPPYGTPEREAYDREHEVQVDPPEGFVLASESIGSDVTWTAAGRFPARTTRPGSSDGRPV